MTVGGGKGVDNGETARYGCEDHLATQRINKKRLAVQTGDGAPSRHSIRIARPL